MRPTQSTTALRVRHDTGNRGGESDDSSNGTALGGSQFQELGVFFPRPGSQGDGELTVVLNATSASGTVVADAIGAAQAWASTGGPTPFETEPSYQAPFQTTGDRTLPNISSMPAKIAERIPTSRAASATVALEPA